jgi:hypothetical protein
MKIRIAILAACASMLALAQADVARANYGAAPEPKSLVRIIAGIQYAFTRTGTCGAWSCRRNGETAGKSRLRSPTAKGKAKGVINGGDLLLSTGSQRR